MFGVYTAEFLGFTSYQPAYLSQEAAGKSLLIGANFASGGSGFYGGTAQSYVSADDPMSTGPINLSYLARIDLKSCSACPR